MLSIGGDVGFSYLHVYCNLLLWTRLWRETGLVRLCRTLSVQFRQAYQPDRL